MKRLLYILSSVLLSSLILAAPAQADNETAEVEFSFKPNSSKAFFKHAFRPATWSLRTTIIPAAGSSKVIPIKQIRLRLPQTVRFNPRSTPVCPDSRLNKYSNTAVFQENMVKNCPRSVVGNGTAALYLAKVYNPSGPNLTDPVLTVFNGGFKNGLPRLKIAGYSKNTGAGLYLEAVLHKNGLLVFSIPVLSYDSAIAEIKLNLPGLDYPLVSARGKTRNFVQARCPHGKFNIAAHFTFGERSATTGVPVSDNTYYSQSASQNCFGAQGRARTAVNIRGNNRVRPGRKAIYRVIIRNNGTDIARNVRLFVRGRVVNQNRRLGAIYPGARRVVRLAVKPRARRGQRARVRLRVVSNTTRAVVRNRVIVVR